MSTFNSRYNSTPEDLLFKIKKSKLLIVRSIIASCISPFSYDLILTISKNNNLPITQKDISNMLDKHRNCFQRTKPISHNDYMYKPNKNFFEKFEKEKALYGYLWPDQINIINQNFNGFGSDLNKTTLPMPKPTNRKIKKVNVIEAIIASTTKPLTLIDIATIAKNSNNYDLPINTIQYFKTNNRKHLNLDKINNSFLLFPNKAFFESRKKNIEFYCNILPDRKEGIIKNFAQYGFFIDGEQVLPAKKPEEKPVKAAAAEVNLPEADKTTDGPTMEVDMELVDIANVGAAIVKYVNQLKRECKHLKSSDPNEIAQLTEKLEESRQVQINLTNENQNLRYQLDKLKGFLDDANEKIKDLNHRVSIVRDNQENEKLTPKSSFTVGEVARVTRLIKGEVQSENN